MKNILVHAKATITERRQEWTHTIHRFFRLTLDNCGGAGRPGARRARGALGRRSAFDLGTSGSRARRTLPLGLVTLGTIQENRLGLGNRGLQDIVAEIRYRRHFCLENIIPHIGNGGAGGDGRLKNILGHVWLTARRAGGAQRSGIRSVTAARMGSITVPAARAAIKALSPGSINKNSYDNSDEQNANKMKYREFHRHTLQVLSKNNWSHRREPP